MSLQELKKLNSQYENEKNLKILYKMMNLINENKELKNYIKMTTTPNFKYDRITSILMQFF